LYPQYKKGRGLKLRIKLKDALEAYESRTGQRMTYEQLAAATGVSRATVESIASRQDYNATLATVGKICAALQCQPADLLELSRDEN
jgi:putative transcriptional regulator